MPSMAPGRAECAWARVLTRVEVFAPDPCASQYTAVDSHAHPGPQGCTFLKCINALAFTCRWRGLSCSLPPSPCSSLPLPVGPSLSTLPCPVPFYSIVRVQKGQHTSTFGRNKFTAAQEHSFSVICDPQVTNGRESLDLVASSEKERDFW